MAKGTHQYLDDPRNTSILININGELLPREDAKISVFDSGFILGDGVWASHWYHSVEQSTYFAAPSTAKFTLTAEQQRVVDEVAPYYEALKNKAITA